MIRFTFKKERSWRYFRDSLRDLKTRLRDLRWAWPEAIRAVESHHLAIFDSEGADNEAGSGPWAPLSELTVRARLLGWGISKIPPMDYMPDSEEGPEGRILHWSHRLRSAMGHGGGLFMGDAVRVMTKRGMEYGTRTPYAKDLHTGHSKRGWRLPVRPILDTEAGPEIAIRQVQKQFDKYIAAW